MINLPKYECPMCGGIMGVVLPMEVGPYTPVSSSDGNINVRCSKCGTQAAIPLPSMYIRPVFIISTLMPKRIYDTDDENISGV